jgi:peroxiredoxin
MSRNQMTFLILGGPKRLAMGLVVLACFYAATFQLRACTIFVLTDTNQALFCNNEDSSIPQTRIWFVPAGEGHLGAAYVGYDNGLAQGGLNSEGLAFDWVAGYDENWKPDPHLPGSRGSSSTRMLETSTNIADAIAYYRTHQEGSFSVSKILVADRSGASVIIGAKDGKLQVDEDNQCRGFGAGWLTLNISLGLKPQPSVTNGFNILRDCRQKGQTATKYSNIYDLKSGDIFLYPFPGRDDEVKLNLTAELKKGAHYYDMAQIQQQLTQEPRPLLVNMHRFPLDEFKPIPDHEPDVTAHVRAMVQDAIDGTQHTNDYGPESWKEIAPLRTIIRTQMRQFGDIVSLTLVDREDKDAHRGYRYRMEFKNGTILQHFVFDSDNKLISGGAEDHVLQLGTNSSQVASDKSAGIGVALGVEGHNLVVNRILPDSPAASHDDIHAGDRIIAVAQDNGQPVPVQGDNVPVAIALIRGPKGTTVQLTIVPAKEPDSKARVVSIVRGELKALVRYSFLTNGMNSPDIEMMDLSSGKTERLSDYAGKIVVLQFWKTSSSPCLKAMEEFKSKAEAHPNWKGKVVLIAASLDDKNDAPMEYLNAHAQSPVHHVWVKSDAIEAWQISGIPSTYVIDQQRKILAAGYVGAMEGVTR